MIVITPSSLLASVVVLILALLCPAVVLKATATLAAVWCRLAAHKRLAVAFAGATAFGLNAGFAFVTLFPFPAVHDEFANVLAAETFALGRLTNPTHEHWEHFQTFYVIHKPTYQSKYPPAQAATMAAGTVLFGHPAWGVWLTLGLATAALCWMLQAWTRPPWALAGAMAFAFSGPVLMQWGQTYWGGGVAFLGGALLFGGVRRLIDSPRISAAVFAALGLALLANSRPYEGLIVSIPPALLLLKHWLRREHRNIRTLNRQVVPITLVLAANFVIMGIYNNSVTGDPFRMPYQEWMAQNGTGLSSFLTDAVLDPEKNTTGEAARVSTVRPKVFHPDPEVNERLIDEFRRGLPDRRSLSFQAQKLFRQWVFYIGPLLTVPFAAGLFRSVLQLHVDPWSRLALCCALLVWTAVLLNTAAGFAHYTAPAGCLMYLFSLNGFRALRLPSSLRMRGNAFTRLTVAAIPLVWLASFIESWQFLPMIPYRAWAFSKLGVEQDLQRADGNHVVFIRYLPGHVRDFEWVYNGPDIDRQRIVWARDLGREKNSRLQEYYPDRRFWLLTARGAQAELASWPEPEGNQQ